MKKAEFSYQSQKGYTILGHIILKDDGKTSVSLLNGGVGSNIDKYRAKALAAEIIKCDLKHASVTNIKEFDTTSKNSLVVILKEQTQSLKKLYIERTKQYAKISFDLLNAKTKIKKEGKGFDIDYEKWYKDYGVQYTYESKEYGDKTPYIKVTKHDKDYYRCRNAINASMSVIEKGFDKYEEKKVFLAEAHYEDSIIKLAQRLNKKGIVNPNEFEIKTAHIGVNIETTIVDKNGNITRAWTIVAEGEIQQPHFRYLIK